MTAVRNKADGKHLAWGYPDYFFGKNPASAVTPSVTRNFATTPAIDTNGQSWRVIVN